MYEVDVYLKEKLISHIVVNGLQIRFENYIDMPVFLPFGIKPQATKKDLEDFYESRCFPRERVNCNDLLRRLDLPFYDPELICRKTHGVQFDDFVWLQFSDEPQVCYSDISTR